VRRARVALGATHHSRLATEDEMREEFPAFDAGAIPPFTPRDLGRVHYPFLPVRLLLRDRYPLAAQLAGVDVPRRSSMAPTTRSSQPS
jgi:hypothetical protein